VAFSSTLERRTRRKALSKGGNLEIHRDAEGEAAPTTDGNVTEKVCVRKIMKKEPSLVERIRSPGRSGERNYVPELRKR